MPTLVHLADERESSNIKKNGLKIGKNRQGIFCMPVLDNFYLSHQWLRELKRNGIKTFVGIYFKIDSQTKVYAGKYNEDHKYITIGEAIKEIKSIEDPLGYEIIIDRKIEATEIQKIKYLPQNIGWRYRPKSNGEKPCGCDFCIRGSIKGNRVREKYEPREKSVPLSTVIQELQNEVEISNIEEILWKIRGRKMRTSPKDLVFLLERNNPEIDRMFALALKSFRHKDSRELLIKLLDSNDNETVEYASDSLLELYGNDGLKILANYDKTPILTATNDWKNKK